ncbi:PepSY-associated TM helix domain-containing protein [Caulobacter hibisci]|uniref:PepSY domain-containing protein n=1 Tax=Caulobacter hibisci TaxID=2035993 RepID=A0ABS0T5A4_9CAUL|nr:PepSY-associated TM helix domain-containing protein [Caulobacter hibisci]MBI1687062.1 PepSY domain-containing protein [Caulobacter hibisci]
MHAPQSKPKPGKPIWPKVPAGFVRAMLAGHSALGLAFAALIYLVCFSGAVAVFTSEFTRWEQPAVPVLHSVTPAAVGAAFEETLAKNPKAHDLFIRMPEPAYPRLSVHGDDAKGAEHTWFADASGKLVAEQRTPWTQFQAALHTVLHLPSSWGFFVVGLTGVALLSSLVSGVLSHPRVFKDAFAFRWGGSKRLQEADLHNRISVWGLPFHVVVSLTGAFLGLSVLIVGVLALVVFDGNREKVFALFSGPPVADDPRPAPVIDVAKGLAVLQAQNPKAGFNYIFVEHPGEAGQHMSVNRVTPGRLSRGETMIVDGNAKVLGAAGFEGGNLGMAIYSSLTPLHFGWFGGWPVKVAYFLLGLGLTAVTASGVAIWLARRRDKGRPAPRWERVWVAFCWSQPLAYGVSAIVALLATGLPPVAVWGGVTLLAAASAFLWTPAVISVRLRSASAVSLALVALVHLGLNTGKAVDPVAWILDASLVLGAVLLAASVWATKKSAAA